MADDPMSILEGHRVEIDTLKEEVKYLRHMITTILSTKDEQVVVKNVSFSPDTKSYVSIVKDFTQQLTMVKKRHYELSFIQSQMRFPVYKQFSNMGISKNSGKKIGFFIHRPSDFGIDGDTDWFSTDDFIFSNLDDDLKTTFTCKDKKTDVLKLKFPPYKIDESSYPSNDDDIKKEIEILDNQCKKIEETMDKMIIPEIKKFHTLKIKKQVALDSGLFIHSIAEFDINKKATECWYSMYDFKFVSSGDNVEIVFI